MANPRGNPQNLKPFKKGQSGNPKGGGKPKKLPQLDVILKNILGSQDKEGRTQAELIIQALTNSAKKGDVKAADLLLNRSYGKVKESVELSTDPDNPLHTKNEHVVIIKRMDTKPLPDGDND